MNDRIWLVALMLGPAACGDDVMGVDGDGSGSTTGTSLTSGSSTDASPTAEGSSGPADSTGAPSTGGSTDDTDTASGSSDTGSPWPRGEGPPTEGWFSFVDDPSGDGFDCLYRWDPDAPPTALMCGSDQSPAGAITVALPPRPGSPFSFAVMEQDFLDVREATWWRIDAATNEQIIVDTWDVENQGEPVRWLREMIPVDDDCVALKTQLLTPQPNVDELRVACIGGNAGQDLLVGPGSEDLLGVLDDGRLVVERNPGGLIVVDPTSLETEPVSGGEDVFTVSHDGQRIAFSVLEPIATTRIGLWDSGVTTWMTDVLGPQPTLGFDPDANVLASSGGSIYVWDGTDDTAGNDIGGGGLGVTRFVGLDETVGYRAVVTDLQAGIGFIAEGTTSSLCGSRLNPQGPARLSDSSEVIVVYNEGDAGDAGVGRIFSCRPNGDTHDLLDGTGIDGSVLPVWD
ncbi:MAG: hypothetical protein K0V04_00375 [Deltaproteobacteria bacterium]|nr:hypothetical protein [Deltaproteobacteria bacterium]